jgi:hypothetical protein
MPGSEAELAEPTADGHGDTACRKRRRWFEQPSNKEAVQLYLLCANLAISRAQPPDPLLNRRTERRDCIGYLMCWPASCRQYTRKKPAWCQVTQGAKGYV